MAVIPNARYSPITTMSLSSGRNKLSSSEALQPWEGIVVIGFTLVAVLVIITILFKLKLWR